MILIELPPELLEEITSHLDDNTKNLVAKSMSDILSRLLLKISIF